MMATMDVPAPQWKELHCVRPFQVLEYLQLFLHIIVLEMSAPSMNSCLPVRGLTIKSDIDNCMGHQQPRWRLSYSPLCWEALRIW